MHSTIYLSIQYMNNLLLDNPSSAESRGKRIRFIRDHLLSKSRGEFCESAGVTAQALKGWELGWGGGLTPQGAEKFVKRVKELGVYCTEEWLLHGVGRDATYLTKDLDIQDSDERHIAKELLLFKEIENSIDAIISDDAMIPLLYPGNYVGGVIAKNINDIIGKDCIVVDDKDEVYIRILKYGDEPGCYNLHCFNEHTSVDKKEIRNITIKMAAPIIWIRRQNKNN